MSYKTVRELLWAKGTTDVERIRGLLEFGYSFRQVEKMMYRNYSIAPEDTLRLIQGFDLHELESPHE